MFPGINRDIRAYATEGYAENPIVFACASIIATACASVKLEVHRTKRDGTKDVLVDHPILRLLAQPNPMQGWEEFMMEMVAWHRVAGEVFILRLPEKGKPAELHLLNPAHMDIDRPKEGRLPLAYIYGTGQSKQRYPVNQLDGSSQVLHIKTFNPTDPWRGLSPLSPSARDVDTHNAGGKWNSSLLTNSARPSGVIEVAGSVTETAADQLRRWFKEAWQGAKNAGAMPILTGGAKFTPLSHNPKDMDFMNSMSSAAKNTGLVYGVPLPLLTMEASTFSNMDAAQERLWTDTVIPLLTLLLKKLGGFLMPLMSERDAMLCYNSDSVPALEAKRERLFKRMKEAVGGGLLTPNEARAEMGFDEVVGGDELLIPGTLKPLNTPQPVTGLAKAMKDSGFSAEEVADALGDAV